MTLLHSPAWKGHPLTSVRTQDLLAALVLASPEAVPDATLLDELWPNVSPAGGAKALQVVVSRTRAILGPSAIIRTANGYQLGLQASSVDALSLRKLHQEIYRATAKKDYEQVIRLANDAMRILVDEASPLSTNETSRLCFDSQNLQMQVSRSLGQAFSRQGDHDRALPLLHQALVHDPTDELSRTDYLRSLAIIKGVNAALDEFETYRLDLFERLGSLPGQMLQQVQTELLAADNPKRVGVLEPTGKLVGRLDDLRQVQGLLRDHRVVTLLGPGGIGKTTLAQEIARTSPLAHVFVVELATVTSPKDVTAEIAHCLSGRPTGFSQPSAWIAEAIGNSPTLLVLDNCEQVVETVATLVAFLAANTTNLHILTTSRAPLSVIGEAVYQLSPLDSPSAVTLFHERALAARPTLPWAPEAAASLVSRLDGLPLAIELAAAATRVFSIVEIMERLDDRFGLLRQGTRDAPDRHQTLQHLFDWSWDLLTEPERRAWASLSVFPESFSLIGADRILGGQSLDLVTALVENSILRTTEIEGRTRYEMLDSIREYGLMRLSQSNQENETRDQLRGWAIELAVRGSASIYGVRQVEVLRMLIPESENLIGILRQGLDRGDQEIIVCVGTILVEMWILHGEWSRVGMLTEICEQISVAQIPSNLHEQARHLMVSLAYLRQYLPVKKWNEASDSLMALGPGSKPRAQAMIEVHRLTAKENGELDLGLLEKVAQMSDRQISKLALTWMAVQWDNNGNMEQAISCAQLALDKWISEDGIFDQASLQAMLGQFHLRLGHLERALEYGQLALKSQTELGIRPAITENLLGMAICLLSLGRREEAAEIAERLEEIDTGGDPILRASRNWVAAELSFLDGKYAAGIALLNQSSDAIPTVLATSDHGLEIVSPVWVVSTAAGVIASARFSVGHHQQSKKCVVLLERTRQMLKQDVIDYPILGTALLALATWKITVDGVLEDDTLALLAISRECGIGLCLPTLTPEYAIAAASRLRNDAVEYLRQQQYVEEDRREEAAAILEHYQFVRE